MINIRLFTLNEKRCFFKEISQDIKKDCFTVFFCRFYEYNSEVKK